MIKSLLGFLKPKNKIKSDFEIKNKFGVGEKVYIRHHNYITNVEIAQLDVKITSTWNNLSYTCRQLTKRGSEYMLRQEEEIYNTVEELRADLIRRMDEVNSTKINIINRMEVL